MLNLLGLMLLAALWRWEQRIHPAIWWLAAALIAAGAIAQTGRATVMMTCCVP